MSTPPPHVPPSPADRRRSSLGSGYRNLLTAAGCANLADGIIKVALPLLAVRLTTSPALVAGVAFAAGLPWLLATLHAGALADRLDRRRTMLLANIARALVLAAFAGTVIAGLDRIWLLYAVALGARRRRDPARHLGAVVPAPAGRPRPVGASERPPLRHRDHREPVRRSAARRLRPRGVRRRCGGGAERAVRARGARVGSHPRRVPTRALRAGDQPRRRRPRGTARPVGPPAAAHLRLDGRRDEPRGDRDVRGARAARARADGALGGAVRGAPDRLRRRLAPRQPRHRAGRGRHRTRVVAPALCR